MKKHEIFSTRAKTQYIYIQEGHKTISIWKNPEDDRDNGMLEISINS